MRVAKGNEVAAVGVMLCGCLGSEDPRSEPPDVEVIEAAEPSMPSEASVPSEPPVAAEPEQPAELEQSSEPEIFSPATRGTGRCVVTVSALLEAQEYRGPGPITPDLEASLDSNPEFARTYQRLSHGDHHIQCVYQVELAHEPGKRYRWRTYFTNTAREATPKACNGMAAEVADDIVQTTKECTDLAAGAYWGFVLEELP